MLDVALVFLELLFLSTIVIIMTVVGIMVVVFVVVVIDDNIRFFATDNHVQVVVVVVVVDVVDVVAAAGTGSQARLDRKHGKGRTERRRKHHVSVYYQSVFLVGWSPVFGTISVLWL